MIRLTEIGRSAGHVDLRVEGNLDGQALTLLAAELARYRREGCRSVRVEADGLNAVTHRIGTDTAWPVGLDVRFTTSRPALGHLLVGYGLVVDLRRVDDA